MKIFAFIHNHSADTGKTFGQGDISWYEMPDSALLRSGNPFFIPDFASDFAAFPTVAYRIGRLGKSIAPKFAHRYIESAGIAVAVVARDLLEDLRGKGLPWTRAVSFDRSCLLGNLEPFDTFTNNDTFFISCGGQNAEYDISGLRHPVDSLIALASETNTLKNGDLLLASVGPCEITLTPGTTLTARSETSKTNLIDINIR